PTSVTRRLRVDRSRRRTPSCPSSSAIRRLKVEIGTLRRRAASEKLFASTTLANITSELTSVIIIFSYLGPATRTIISNSEKRFPLSPACYGEEVEPTICGRQDHFRRRDTDERGRDGDRRGAGKI